MIVRAAFLAPHLAARNGGVEVIAAEGVDPFGKNLGLDRGDGAHVDHSRAGGQAFANAVDPEEKSSNVGGVGHHDCDDLGLIRDLAAGAVLGRAAVDELLRRGLEIPDKQLVARGQQMAAMGRPMIPAPMKPI